MQQFALSASHAPSKMMEGGQQWVDSVGPLPGGTPSGFTPAHHPGFPIAPPLALPIVSAPQSTTSPLHSQHYSTSMTAAPDRMPLMVAAHMSSHDAQGYPHPHPHQQLPPPPQPQPQPQQQQQRYHQFQQHQLQPPHPHLPQPQLYPQLYGQQHVGALQTSVPAVQPQLQLLANGAAASGSPLMLLSPGQQLFQLASPVQLNTAAGSPIVPQFVVVQPDQHSGSGSMSKFPLEAMMPASVLSAVHDATRCVEQLRACGMPLPPAPAHPESGAPLQKVLVKHIGQDITDAQIRQIFATCGSVHTARIAREQGTRRSLGFGFIEYDSTAEAALAVACLNRLGLDGKRLRVVWADRPPAPRVVH